MTYFTLNDDEEPVEIKDGKGMCGNFCVGANLDEDDLEKTKEDEISAEPIQDSHLIEDYLEKKSPGRVKTALFWICGVESVLKQGGNKSDQPAPKVDTSIEENKWLSRLCDVNAIIAISLSGFCIAFFNRYDF